MPRHRRAAGHPEEEQAAASSAAASDAGATAEAAPGAADGGGADAGNNDDRRGPWPWQTATVEQEQAPAGGEAATQGAETGDNDLETTVIETQAKADEYLANWQRAAADMANMRRRHEQDRQEYQKQANAQLIASLLPVLDSYDRALATMPEGLRDDTWIGGLVHIERQLRGALERAGLEPIEAEGQPFDPNVHEAVMQEVSDQPENTVIGELQRGYKLHDRVLRPSMVKVAKSE